jgi:Fe-S oxidoreductase
MCPSYRATAEEQHLTRGRANTLRLALSGQLGRDALVSEPMRETMALCLSCKACARECPVGVDMARLKLEFLYQWRKTHALTLRDRLVAYLPRYAPWASRFRALPNLRNLVPVFAAWSERATGFAAKRRLPRWQAPYREGASVVAGREVVLLVDTFTRWFEPENARAAERVLTRAGYRVVSAQLPGERPLCCGRSFLAVGLIDEARNEARRMLAALAPYVARGVPVIGLEPSCLLTLRDEFTALLPGAESAALGMVARLFEEFIAEEAAAGRWRLALNPLPGKAVLHTHCHQKAHNAAAASAAALKLIPGLEVESLDTTCCGMAGAFGYEAEHYEISLKIGELGVLPRMRAAPEDATLLAVGTSCRHQIAEGAGRTAVHPAILFDRASA